ncbi:MAG: family 10 glycosylhydrolase [Pirellulales bacterium]
MRRLAAARARLAVAVCVLLSTATTARADVRMHFRFAWGGVHRQWQGEISIDRGQFTELRALGLEADEPGSIWHDDRHVYVRQPSGRVYDGVDVVLTAPRDGVLTVDLQPVDGEGGIRAEVPLRSLESEQFRREMDPLGNHLVIRRAPGSRLRIITDRDALVFRPGEMWELSVLPRLEDVAAGLSVRVNTQLTAARGGRPIWSQQTETTIQPWDDVESGQALRLQVPIPQQEGPYALSVQARRLRFGRLATGRPVAERSIQFVVIADQRSTDATQVSPEWSTVLEIDPTDRHWWDRLFRWRQLTTNSKTTQATSHGRKTMSYDRVLGRALRIPGLPQGPLGHGQVEVWQSDMGPLMRLGSHDTSSDASWQAYPLPIREVGRAHLLEVEYPAGVAQDLGISIVEPNAAGLVAPAGIDSGVYVSENRDDQGRAVHRLLFWPKTRTPLLLLVNQRRDADAVYGTIRVQVAHGSIGGGANRSPATGRLVAGYFDRPLFPENFSATDRFDPGIGKNVDDWRTFFEGGIRLVDYLQYRGYNGLMLSVLADGSTIYPSQLLAPTPRYDTGILATNGMDPVRKDGLEMLLRLFDREGLRLVPSLQFAAPLPKLERLGRQQTSQETGIEWIDGDGKSWRSRRRPVQGLAPYYNPLNKDVQQAMLDVVHELMQRYGRHEAFAGLGLQLTGAGYAQLLGPEWGFDDLTIARFERDTKIDVPGKGPQRFSQRARFLLSDEGQKARWLAWRATELEAFYRRIQQEVATARPNAKLYLATAELLDQPGVQRKLRPTLTRRARAIRAMLELGIRPDQYKDTKIVLLRPQFTGSLRPLAGRAVDIEVNGSMEIDQQFATTRLPGSLFFHRARYRHLPSFDRKSPFGSENTYLTLTSQLVPSGAENRRRFAHSLASLDARAFFDGGNLLSLGQEDALRSMVDVIRQLPADGYQAKTVYRQPVTIRTLAGESQTWVYLVNDSPWPVKAELPLTAPDDCRMQELGMDEALKPLPRQKGSIRWNLEIAPYGVAAARFTTADVQVGSPRVDVDQQIAEALGRRVQELSDRAASLRDQPVPNVLTNPDFEASESEGAIAGWNVDEDSPAAGATVDSETVGHGTQSVKLWSKGREVTLRSQPFDVPATGRLALKVWLRAGQATNQPELKLAIEGPREFYRYASVGGPQGNHPLSEKGREVTVLFSDLPVGRIDQIWLRFDLKGAGHVWIDNVQLDPFYFGEAERNGLFKIIFTARQKLKNNELSDCLRLLDSYWPRFLVENVQRTHRPVARQAPKPPATLEKREEKPRQPSMAERVKGLLPGFMRF